MVLYGFCTNSLNLTPRYARCRQSPILVDASEYCSGLCTQNLLTRIVLDLLNAVLSDRFDHHAFEIDR